jgi:GT2 family glycosyltransferase
VNHHHPGNQPAAAQASASRLGIVILNWNAAHETIECVRSILDWRSVDGEIWVVDNASKDGSPELIAQECPAVNLICSPNNRGFAGGNNLGIEKAIAAGCTCVLLLNNDANIAEDDLVRLCGVLRDRPSVGIVGPLLAEGAPPSSTLRAGGRDIGRHLATHVLVDAAPTTLQPVDYVSGTVALVRADVFRAVGLFDEAYFFSGEMADLCWRARDAGYACVIEPASRASHRPHARSGQRDTLYMYYSLRNRFLFVHKFYKAESRRMCSAWVVRGLVISISALARGQYGQARAAWWAVWDGLRGRYGDRNRRFLKGHTVCED